MDPTTLQCPVCRARFRRVRHCTRCGADLSPLMTLAAKAFMARRASREALRQGNFGRSHELALQAQGLCDTQAGRRLCTLTAWFLDALQSWFGLPRQMRQ